MPSMVMVPSDSSSMRKRQVIREDLPLPLRPQIPSFSPGAMERERALMIGGPVGVYAAVTLENSIAPVDGQSSGTSCVSARRFSEAVVREKVMRRAIAPKEVSRVVQVLMISARDSLKLMTLRRARPTKPPEISARSLTTRIIRMTARTATRRSRIRASQRWIQKRR